MGMAASQARLLFITSRQTDVDAKMQRISQQTMILARDSEEVADKYNRMLTATVLQSDSVDLSYDSMMGTNAKDTSKIITVGDSTSSDYGKVVLSSGMASAYGLSGTGGSKDDFLNSTYGGSNKAFIAHVMGKSEADVETLLASYKAKGGQSGGNGTAKTLTLNDILNNSKTKDSYTGFTLQDDDSGTNLSILGSTRASTAANNLYGNTAYRDQYNISNKAGTTGIYGIYGDSINTSWGTNGTKTNQTWASVKQTSNSISDLYNNAGQFSGTMLLGWVNNTANWQTKPTIGTEVLKNLENLIGSIGSAILTGFENSGITDPDVEALVNKTTQQAYSDYSSDSNLHWNESFYKGVASDKGYTWNDQDFDYDEDMAGAALMAAQGQTGLVAAACSRDGQDRWMFAVDAGTLVKNILDEVVKGLVGTSALGESATQKNVLDPTKEYTILSKYSDGVSTSGKSKASFTDEESRANYLDTIYSKLSSKGWIVDDTVSNNSTLQEKLKNGQYHMDGSTASNSSKVETRVYTDAEAEAYYEKEQAKIKRKEKQYETELTKLQSESTALTNDLNSVKAILDANIQRSFTYCQNG